MPFFSGSSAAIAVDGVINRSDAIDEAKTLFRNDMRSTSFVDLFPGLMREVLLPVT